MKERLNKKAIDCVKSGIRVYHEMASQLDDCIDMSLGEVHFNTPRSIIKATVDALNNNETRYTSNQGLYPLRVKLAEYENQSKSLHYEPSEILITQGASEAITCSLLSILEKEDEVLIPIPAYSGYENMIKLAHGICIPFECDEEYQIDEVNLKSKLTSKSKAIIITSPNNPTGCIMNSKSLQIVAKIAKEAKLFIILDLVYDKLCDEIQTFNELSKMKEQLIIIHSFSKTYAMSGFRLGYLMVDNKLMDTFIKVHQSLVSCVNTFVQVGAMMALDDNENNYPIIIDKRRYIMEELSKNDIEFVEPKGAFYLFIKIEKYYMDSTSFSNMLLNDYHVISVPGIIFHDDKGIRVSYCLGDQRLQEGVKRIILMIQKLEKSRN